MLATMTALTIPILSLAISINFKVVRTIPVPVAVPASTALEMAAARPAGAAVTT